MSVERLGGAWTIVLPLPSDKLVKAGDADAQALDEAHDFLGAELAKLAGGYTAQNSVRFWIDDFGKASLEDGLIYTVFVDVGLSAIQDIAERAAIIGRQQAVHLIDPENVGWLVRPPANAVDATPKEQAHD
jgi:hypothetical protein